MDAFRAFKLYTAVNLHFKQDSFDLFETGGALKGSVETFNHRNDRKIFERWARKWSAPEFIKLCAANCMYGNPQCVYDPDTAERNYRLYEKRRQAITKVFADDLSQLDSLDEKAIIQKMMAKKITLETCVILYEILGLFSGDFPKVLDPVLRRIRKSARFVRYRRAKIEKVLCDADHLRR